MRSTIHPILLLLASAAACSDQPVEPRLACTIDAPAQLLGEPLPVESVAPLLTDASQRLGPALGDGDAALHFTRRLAELQAIWRTGTAESRCRAINAARAALARLDDPATLADQVALGLALDAAAATAARLTK